MAKQALVVDRESILNSYPIHIVHRHPDFAHRIRSDLDPGELVAAHYPLELADKLIPFLEKDEIASVKLARQISSQPASQRQDVAPDTPFSQASTVVATTRPSSLLFDAKKPTRREQLTTTKFFSTPTRQLLASPSFSPDRTVSPSGRFYSPLTKHDTTSSRLLFTPPKHLGDIPSAFFSLPHARSSQPVRASPAAQVQRQPMNWSQPNSVTQSQPQPRQRRRGPPPLVEFDTEPRSVEYHWARPVLNLRHDVSTQALSDVLEWAKVCVAEGRVTGLDESLIHFRDYSRVREIREVCLVLKIKSMQKSCEELLRKWDGVGEGITTSEVEDIGRKHAEGIAQDNMVPNFEDRQDKLQDFEEANLVQETDRLSISSSAHHRGWGGAREMEDEAIEGIMRRYQSRWTPAAGSSDMDIQPAANSSDTELTANMGM